MISAAESEEKSSRWQSRLLKLARFLYRGEATAAPARDLVVKVAFFAVASSVFSYLFFAIRNEQDFWKQAYPGTVIERSEWRAKVLSEKLDCEPKCPLSFAHSSFWKTSGALTETEISTKLKEGNALEVWLGLSLHRSRVWELRENSRTYLVLGWLKGSYSLWVNGELLQKISADEFGPQVFALPVSHFSRPGNLDLVIRLHPRPGAKNLVPFTASMKEGFADYRSAQAFRSFHRFTEGAKPIALFLVYFVLSGFFFLLWVASPRNREYVHLSAFAIVCSIPNLLFADIFSFRLSPATSMNLYLMIIFCKTISGMNLGFSFSRTRTSLVFWLTVSLLISGALLVAVAPQTVLSGLRKPLNQHLISLGYAIGAFSCFLQAMSLSLREKQGFSFQFRKEKLLQFSFILFALAGMQFLQYGSFFSSVEIDIFWDVPEVALAVFLGFIALSDYRTQYEMVEKTPLSVYHKRPSLPESVSGLLVMLDLKNSEQIFRSTLDGNTPFQMPAIISMIWSAIAESGGVVIKAEGDEVIAFFDDEKHPNPLRSALEASDRCYLRLQQVAKENDASANATICFRMGMAAGRIRPIWVGQGRDRLPAWTQTEDSMVFVDCARIMEAERELQKTLPENSSLVVIANELLQKHEIEEKLLHGTVVTRGKRIRGKHDRIYAVTCYCPAGLATEERKNAA